MRVFRYQQINEKVHVNSSIINLHDINEKYGAKDNLINQIPN